MARAPVCAVPRMRLTLCAHDNRHVPAHAAAMGRAARRVPRPTGHGGRAGCTTPTIGTAADHHRRACDRSPRHAHAHQTGHPDPARRRARVPPRGRRIAVRARGDHRCGAAHADHCDDCVRGDRGVGVARRRLPHHRGHPLVEPPPHARVRPADPHARTARAGRSDHHNRHAQPHHTGTHRVRSGIEPDRRDPRAQLAAGHRRPDETIRLWLAAMPEHPRRLQLPAHRQAGARRAHRLRVHRLPQKGPAMPSTRRGNASARRRLAATTCTGQHDGPARPLDPPTPPTR